MRKVAFLFFLIIAKIGFGQPLYYMPSTEIRIEDQKDYTTGFTIDKLKTDYNLMSINASFYILRLYIVEEKLDSARLFLDELESQSFNKKDQLVQIASLYFKGRLDAMEGVYQSAFKQYIKADSIALTSRNFKFHNYIQLGLVEMYRKQSNYVDALDLLSEIKGNIFVSNMDTFAVIEYYNRYAAILNETSGNKLNLIDSSAKYSNLAIQLCEKINSNNRLAVSYNELGFSYELRNDLEIAISYYQKACKYWSKTSNYRNYLNSLVNLARVYSKQKKYIESNAILDKMTEQAENTRWIRLLASLYDLKSVNMEHLGNYKYALEYKKLSVIYMEKVFIENNSIALTKLEKKYKSDKFEKRLTDMENQNQKLQAERKWVVVALVILLLVIIVGIYVYYNTDKTAKSILQKNTHLENSQKELISRLNEKEEEIVKLRKRLKELTDLIG